MKLYTLVMGECREWYHEELVEYLRQSNAEEALKVYQAKVDSLPRHLSSDHLPIAFGVHTPVGYMTFVFAADL